MWWFFMNLLSNPVRSLRTWVIGIAVGGVLLLALANAGPAMQGTLGGILAAAALLMVIRVPMRIVLTLMIAAVVIVSAVSLISEVLASGYVPLIMIGVGLAIGLGAWARAGAPGLRAGSLSDVARQVFRGPPRSRGARWATLRELQRAGFLGVHGWLLGAVDGHIVRLPVEREREGLMVTATTGAGKTSVLVIPALIEEASRPPELRRDLVIVDPKAELTPATIPTLATTHRVLVWDPSDPGQCTVGFDPLATLPKVTDESFVGEVKQLAHAFFWATRGGEKTSDPFWITQPRALMEALFLAFIVARPTGTFVDLAIWTRSLKIEAFQNMLDQSTNGAVRGCAETLRAVGMSDKTIGPIFGDVLQRFDVLDDPRVRRSMTGPTWSFDAGPTALYLRVGAQDAQRLAPLLSMALGHIYRELTKAAARHPGNKLARECRIIIDEFGNLPRILGVETALATLRSYGVGHYAFLQSSSQLIHHYGRELAATIQDNLVTKIVMGGASDADAKSFSLRCGEITEFHPTRSWSGRGPFRVGSENFSHAPDRRPLVSAAEIIHMKDEILVSTRGIAPLRLAARPYYADPETVRRLEADRLAYEQRVAAGAAPRIASPPTPAAPASGRGSRDIPPPGCSAQEWDAAAASLRVALWSLEDDLFALVTGRVVDLDQIREQWRRDPSRSTPARYAKITAAERAKAPAVGAYVDELALRLELRHEDDDPPLGG